MLLQGIEKQSLSATAERDDRQVINNQTISDMTPQDNIRWYWEDLSTAEKVHMLVELYTNMSAKEKKQFSELTENY